MDIKMNKISYYHNGILKTTSIIAIIMGKKIAVEKGFS
jgi:hypothetical protein